jgi:hypothetical protein
MAARPNPGSEPLTSYTLNDIDTALPGRPRQARPRPGWFAKLMFVPDPPGRGVPESLWVKVVTAADDTYTGSLSNHPGPSKGLPAFGDEVAFEDRHIIATARPSD